MGQYHNKLDRKYFNKSVYIKKFEATFGVNIKDYPLQYELVYTTLNTLLMINNILFSRNYIPYDQKVDKIIGLLDTYLHNYHNKINKCYDKECIILYELFEETLDELNEMKELHDKSGNHYNLISLERNITPIIHILDAVNFDKLIDSKDMPYVKLANDKLPKKVNLKLIDDLSTHQSILYDIDKQAHLNDEFISNYYERTGLNLNDDMPQRHFIFETLNRVKDLNNAIVDCIIYKDKCVLNIFADDLQEHYLTKDTSFVKDITFIAIFHKLERVATYITNDQLNEALDILKSIMAQFNDLYERTS